MVSGSHGSSMKHDRMSDFFNFKGKTAAEIVEILYNGLEETSAELFKARKALRQARAELNSQRLRTQMVIATRVLDAPEGAILVLPAELSQDEVLHKQLEGFLKAAGRPDLRIVITADLSMLSDWELDRLGLVRKEKEDDC